MEAYLYETLDFAHSEPNDESILSLHQGSLTKLLNCFNFLLKLILYWNLLKTSELSCPVECQKISLKASEENGYYSPKEL